MSSLIKKFGSLQVRCRPAKNLLIAVQQPWAEPRLTNGFPYALLKILSAFIYYYCYYYCI